MRTIAAACLLAAAFATSAQAQELGTSVAAYTPFGVADLDAAFPPSAEFRFAVRLSDRFAVEPFVSVASRTNRRSAGLEGFYGAQIRQRIARITGQVAYLFTTYGAAAYYSKYGSLAPVFGQFGFGLHQHIAERLVFRPEIQVVTFHVVPIGARFLAGLSVDLGR
jgi:hypothetical protein